LKKSEGGFLKEQWFVRERTSQKMQGKSGGIVMSRLSRLVVVGAVILGALMILGCAREEEPLPSEAPVSAAGETPSAVNLVQDGPGAALDLPSGALEEGLEAVLEEISVLEYPAMTQEGFEIIGNPVSVKVAGHETVMLSEKGFIEIPISPEVLRTLGNPDDVYAGYYDGDQWEYFLPEAVDLEKGFLRIGTYHFSFFGAGRLSEEKQIERFANQMAVQSWAQKTDEETMVQALESYFKEAFNGMGISGESAQGKLIRSIVKENDIGALVVSAEAGNAIDFQARISEMAGKAVLDHYSLDSGFLGKAMNTTTTASKALAYLLENDYEGAQKEIANGIMDHFPAGKAMKAAVEAVDAGINSWKTYEIESAYEAFKNGAAKERGYDVTPGNFEELLVQMKGVITRIHTEAIRDYANARGISRDRLTQAEINLIKSRAEIKLKNQFEARRAAEAEIAATVPEHLRLIEAFKRGGLMDRAKFGFDSDQTLEDRLRQLYTIKNALGELMDEKNLLPEEWVRLMGIWLTDRTPGRQKVHEAIKEYQNLPAVTQQNPEGVYQWVKVGEFTNDWESELNQRNEGASWMSTISDGGTSATFVTTLVVDPGDSWAKQGMSQSGRVEWSPPPEVIIPGEAFSLQLTASHLSRSHDNMAGIGSVIAQMAILDDQNNILGATPLKSEEGQSLFAATSSNGYTDQTAEVFGVLGAGDQYSRMGIQISASNGGVAIQRVYVYEYQPR